MNKIKFELKVIKNNMVVRFFKLIRKPCMLVSSNRKQILKVVDGRSSLINFARIDYTENLMNEWENIFDLTGKDAVIIRN